MWQVMMNTIKEKIKSGKKGRECQGGLWVGNEMLLHTGWGGSKSWSENIWADTWRKMGSKSHGCLKELSKWRETALAEALGYECRRIRKRPVWWEHREVREWEVTRSRVATWPHGAGHAAKWGGRHEKNSMWFRLKRTPLAVVLRVDNRGSRVEAGRPLESCRHWRWWDPDKGGPAGEGNNGAVLALFKGRADSGVITSHLLIMTAGLWTKLCRMKSTVEAFG